MDKPGPSGTRRPASKSDNVDTKAEEESPLSIFPKVMDPSKISVNGLDLTIDEEEYLSYCTGLSKATMIRSDGKGLHLTDRQLKVLEGRERVPLPEAPHIEHKQLRKLDFFITKTKLGHGTHGEVFEAYDKEIGRVVAIKRLIEHRNHGVSRSTIREAIMLRRLKHENIIELIEICSSGNNLQFLFLYELCQHDLSGIIDLREAELSLTHIKTITLYLFEALRYLHDLDIIHRDIKPPNLLIDKNGIVKLCDFGLSKKKKLGGQVLTTFVATMDYRAPELLLGQKSYGFGIDMWAAGCVFIEMFKRVPLFRSTIANTTDKMQLIRIISLCGSITPENFPGVEKLHKFREYGLPADKDRILRNHLADENAIDLAENLLQSPRTRLTAERALKHEYFTSDPKPAENLRDLLDQLPDRLFEYTLGHSYYAQPLSINK